MERTVVVPRDAVATYGERARVEAVIHDGVEHTAYALSQAAPHDMVKLRLTYAVGEEVPGEGIVRTRTSVPTLVAGLVTIGSAPQR